MLGEETFKDMTTSFQIAGVPELGQRGQAQDPMR